MRQQQAEATRSRVVATAAKLFASDGYARTTLAKIAEEAGVSAETVQGQGPKAALLIAAIEYAAFGVTGEENIFNLDVGRKLLVIDDCDEAVDFVVAAQTDVHARTAQLALALIGGASADPELDRYLEDFNARLNQQVRRVFDAFWRRGWLRTDVRFNETVETAAVLCSVETYLRIVHRDGWSDHAYRRWLRRLLSETVFSSPHVP